TVGVSSTFGEKGRTPEGRPAERGLPAALTFFATPSRPACQTRPRQELLPAAGDLVEAELAQADHLEHAAQPAPHLLPPSLPRSPGVRGPAAAPPGPPPPAPAAVTRSSVHR